MHLNCTVHQKPVLGVSHLFCLNILNLLVTFIRNTNKYLISHGSEFYGRITCFEHHENGKGKSKFGNHKQKTA